MPLFANIVGIMGIPENKRFYKVISLFIKTMILLLSFYYIWQKIKTADTAIDFSELITSSNKISLLLICSLVAVNWGLEAMKWKLLIAPLEQISFITSVKSVLAGVTISIFSPNRMGEFAGRIFILESEDKIRASVMSMIGSMMQLLVTVIAGVAAYFILEVSYYDFFQTARFISVNGLLLLIFGALLIAMIVLIIYLKRDTTFIKYKKYIEVFSLYSKSELFAVFALSLIRYLVFATQYYLILRLFGINAGITILFSLIALTFFVTSAIPTFALTEIAVRGATAVYFFNTIHPDSTSVIASSLLLWLINLAFPALIGALFVGNLKFFKDPG